MRTRLRHLAALAALSAPILLAPVLTTSAQAHAAPRSSRATLAAEIRASLKGDGSRHVDYRVEIDGLGTISHDAQHASAPASNEKIFTALTLLQQVGPDFTYQTRVSGASAISHGTEHGDLVLVGSGDPTLTKADLARMARQLHRRGLRHVTGHLVVDDTRYSHRTLARGWKNKFVPQETGPVDAFSVDDNAWRGGRRFLADPTPANAALWRQALLKAHITIAGATRIEAAPATSSVLLRHESVTLAALDAAMLTPSVNFYAEMMLREAGAQRTGHGTIASGVDAERAVAADLGLPFGTAYDGSGLSYSDRQTPATIESWLDEAKNLSTFNAFFDALPIACETGTIEHRLCGVHTRGAVRAKTGTLDHISALSGYARTEAGHQVVFSFLASGVHHFARLYRRLDATVGLLVRKG